ncbi:hypothetical protein [Streptomyces sp. NEAU-NA10]
MDTDALRERPPGGHTCVPADDGVDLYGLADALDAFRAHWFESWNG